MNPLLKIAELGQVVWLDELNRELVAGPKLKQCIERDRLGGMTFNPSGFRKALEANPLYEPQVRDLLQHHVEPKEILERVSVRDEQMAADLFRPTYDQTEGGHGFVTVEIDPHLAHDLDGMLRAARRLWEQLERPNIYIKIPATPRGLSATKELIREGINVNVSFLFGVPSYREAANAFMVGLEHRLQDGLPIEQVRSVASFSLCEIDRFFDPVLDSFRLGGGPSAEQAGWVRGEVAVASGKVAYQTFLEMMRSSRWKRLAKAGAHPQWLVWTGTSADSASQREVKYVEALIGPSTISAMPEAVLDAYREQGQPKQRLLEGADEAREVLAHLGELGIDLDRATQQLAEEALDKVCRPFDQALHTLADGNVRGAIEVRRSAPLR